MSDLTSSSRAQLRLNLDALDAKIPSLLDAHPDPDEFWAAFAGESDFATESARSEDYDWVNTEIDDLLRKHGVAIPTDEPPVDG